MTLGRVGFGGRAVLYAMIALIAGRIAVGLPGEAGAQGAIQAISDLPLGVVALPVVALCLAGFGAWAMLQAVHPDAELDPSGRISRAAQSLFYLGVAVLAGMQVFGSGGGGGGTQSLTSTLLSSTPGRLAIGAVGVALLVVAGRQFWRAWTNDLREDLDRSGSTPPGWSRTVGRLGYAGRGLTYVLVGGFVVRAAVNVNPNDATGLDVALDELSRSVAGRVAVVVVAGGLLMIAIWFALVARHGIEDEVEVSDMNTG